MIGNTDKRNVFDTRLRRSWARLEGWATTLLQRAHVLPIGLQLGYSLLPSWPFKKILEISREFMVFTKIYPLTTR